MIDINLFIKKTTQQIEDTLNALIPEQDVPHRQLFEAARYSLIGGGKRLRPLLTLATTETFGIDNRIALNAACAIEMIHTYSLIHDDLPCMDDDDFRRGKPSLHKAYSEGHAVLAGDYLLTFAFEVIAQDPHLEADQKVALVGLLAKNSGAHGMIGGQVMDIEAEGKQIDVRILQQIHRHKTGAMITASLKFGGIIAGANQGQLEALQLFGEDLGLAFQIIDDVLDVTASEKKHGKAIASDEINNKMTYVTLLGLEPARRAAFELLHSGKEHLRKLNCNSLLLENLADRLVKREI